DGSGDRAEWSLSLHPSLLAYFALRVPGPSWNSPFGRVPHALLPHAALTLIWCGFASSFLGIRIVSMPCLQDASARAVLRSAGSCSDRENSPTPHSRRWKLPSPGVLMSRLPETRKV